MELNGLSVGRAFEVGSQCPPEPDLAKMVLSAETFNAAVAGGDAVIDLIPSSDVHPDLCNRPSFVTVRVAYPIRVDDCNGNGVPDECEDCNGNGRADSCDIANGTSSDCNDNGIPDECDPVPTCEPVIAESDPLDGFIDPRGQQGGADQVRLTFNIRVTNVGGDPLDASAFTITSTDNPAIPGPPVVPGVFTVDVSPDGKTVVVTLTRPISVAEWTTLTANVEGPSGIPSAVSVRVGWLPCDVNQNGYVTLSDAGAFGRAWREMPPPTELIDMDRSSVVTLADAGLFGALFKGRRGFRVWEGMSLPPMPE